MALSNIEEERKRKEAAAKQLTPTTDPFLASMARGNYNTPGPVVKQAKPTPGNPMSESFYGGPDNSPRTRPQIGQLQPDGSRMVIDERPLVQSNNIKPPTLKEIPNAQRDAELGKMTVSTKGNIATYDIGGNTLSIDLSQKDRPSLKNINRPSGNAPTWDDYHRQQRARLNTTRGGYYGPTPLPTETSETKDNSFGGLFLQGLQMKKDRTNDQIENDIALQDINRTEAETQAKRNLLLADQNRISEMDVQGQNKLRDIQGQVAQEPPAKESRLKPIIIEESDPTDPTGARKRQRLLMPNADETGYVDGTPGQSGQTLTNELPENHPAIKFLKDNPSQASNFKAKYGYLPDWAVSK